MEWYYEKDRNGAHIQVLGLEKKELKILGKYLDKSIKKEINKLEKKREYLQDKNEGDGLFDKQYIQMLDAEDDSRFLQGFLNCMKNK